MRRGDRGLQAAIFLSRWLLAPFLLGLICCLLLLLYRFFVDLYQLALQLPNMTWQGLVVGVLYLVDIALTANLILIVIFSGYENFIGRFRAEDHPDRPEGLTNVDFGALKQKLLGSIVVIAAVDALSWDLELEKDIVPAKFAWAIAFPLMFVIAMLLLAIADRLGRGPGQPSQ